MRQLAAIVLLLISVGVADAYNGIGCTTAFKIDEDCDGYGVGVGYVAGIDADDTNAAINTTASVEAIYGNITTAPNTTIVANLKAFFATTRGWNNIGDIYFISPTGDDATGAPNDITKPYRYFGQTNASGVKSSAAFGAGDIVIYRGGVYNTNLSGGHKDQINTQYSMPAGTATSPIVFTSFPGEIAQFSAGLRGIAGVNGTGYKQWVIFDTLRIGDPITPTADYGITQTGANEVTFRYVEVVNKNGDGIKLMSNVYWPTASIRYPLTNVLIDRCVISRTRVAEHNIYIGHAIPKSYNIPATGLHIRNIISHSNDALFDGMQLNGHFDGWIVEGSQFHSASSWGVAFLNGPSNGTFKNNLLFNNNSNQIKIGKYVGFVGNNTPNAEANVTGNLFVNNTLWTGDLNNGNGNPIDPSDWNAVYLYTEESCETDPWGIVQCSDLSTFHSNTFRNNIMVSHGSGVIRADQRGHLENSTFNNNVFYRSDGTNMVANLKNFTETWTATQFESDATISATNNTYGNPLFVDVAYSYASNSGLFDFHLQTNSPANGIAVDSVVSDLNGATRGPLPDAGAYELDIAVPTTTASPAAGTYTSSQSVTLSTGEMGTTTHYTTDGATPTTSSPVYTGPITILSTTTLKWFSMDTAGNQEAVKSATYNITPALSTTYYGRINAWFKGMFR